MARQITTEKGLTTLSISADQKAKLIKLAEKYAVGSMSAFVGAIADGKYRIMSEDACELVDKLLDKRAARKERYDEAKKQKEEDNANH